MTREVLGGRGAVIRANRQSTLYDHSNTANGGLEGALISSNPREFGRG